MNRIEAARVLASAGTKLGQRMETQIDEGCPVAPVTGHGVWVQAWLFVPDTIIDDFIEETA